MPDNLQFHGWRRSGIYDLSDGTTDDLGRLQANVRLQFTETDAGGQLVDQRIVTIPFDIQGPAAVTAFRQNAVSAMYPPDGARGTEPTFCAHVEFTEPDLPWRYTPQLADGRQLRPWLALLVGRESTSGGRDGEITLDGKTATVSAAVLRDHPLQHSARWAHIQEHNGHDVARLLSPRTLQPKTGYICVVVPALDENGQDRWRADIGAALALPVYHYWRFHTGDEGDFRTLASRLKPEQAGPDMGGATLYVDDHDSRRTLFARGAMGPIGGRDRPLDADTERDLRKLVDGNARDPDGRPVTSLPHYGDQWRNAPFDTRWGEAANFDPRHRVAAGLGRAAVVAFQDILVTETRNQAGDLYEATSVVRASGAGMRASEAMWKRRLPQNRDNRIALFGPAFARLIGEDGSVMAKVSGKGRPLAAAVLSTAARRILRKGSARGRFTQPGATDPSIWLPLANLCPAPPPKYGSGLPHIDKPAAKGGYKDALDALNRLHFRSTEIKADLGKLGKYVDDVLRVPEDSKQGAKMVLFAMLLRAILGKKMPVIELYRLYEIGPDTPKAVDKLEQWGRNVNDAVAEIEGTDDAPPDDAVFRTAIPPGSTKAERNPCLPTDLDLLDRVVTDAFDPTRPDSRHRERPKDRIDGLGPDPLAPLEICFDYDIAPWVHLRDTAPDWLAPGAGSLPADSVTALETNPAFIDAFLLGFNTELSEELRWRNTPLKSGCTPVRIFWGRISADHADRRDRDIEPVEGWLDQSRLGAEAHKTPEAAGVDLVLLFRSDLFDRYPRTIISLVRAPQGPDGEPDWDGDPIFGGPDADQRFPRFMGALGKDKAFFGFDIEPADARRYWVVLEEPPSGFRFLNQADFVSDDRDNDSSPRERYSRATDGAAFAEAAFNDPTLVMIRGDSIIADN